MYTFLHLQKARIRIMLVTVTNTANTRIFYVLRLLKFMTNYEYIYLYVKGAVQLPPSSPPPN